jgi:5-methylcytosine-specific restriction endonuclease McrA
MENNALLGGAIGFLLGLAVVLSIIAGVMRGVEPSWKRLRISSWNGLRTWNQSPMSVRQTASAGSHRSGRRRRPKVSRPNRSGKSSKCGVGSWTHGRHIMRARSGRRMNTGLSGQTRRSPAGWPNGTMSAWWLWNYVQKHQRLLRCEWCNSAWPALRSFDGHQQLICGNCAGERAREAEQRDRRRRRGMSGIKKRLIAKRGSRCERCGIAGDVIAHHKRRLMDGGTNRESNLVLLCEDCHRAAHSEGTRW